ncbi:hypothetical protein [Terrimonas sp.]|uniref:hypothetical protein n=1 Tax=Terrimonas sp. TaxID=1914338 RepID=UPI001057341D|nr:hypothetical protein [Terrimonas sp.]
MKKTFVLLLCCGLMYTFANAQSVIPDPTLSEKAQKEILKTSKRLEERKLELIKLEKEVEDAKRIAVKKEKDAQVSADENVSAASKLNNDALDKTKARKARKKASKAADDAKDARKAAKKAEKLENNISSLQKKIQEDETRLAEMTHPDLKK